MFRVSETGAQIQPPTKPERELQQPLGINSPASPSLTMPSGVSLSSQPLAGRYLSRSNSTLSTTSSTTTTRRHSVTGEQSKRTSLGSKSRGTLPRLLSYNEDSSSTLNSGGRASSVVRALHKAGTQPRLASQRSKTFHLESTGGLRASILSPTVEFEVESWCDVRQKWTNEAVLKVNKNRGKVTLESGFGKVKLKINASLRIEHVHPISRDFNIILSGHGDRCRIAVFSEEAGEALILILIKLGASVVHRKFLAAKSLSRGSLRTISENEALASVQPFRRNNHNMLVGTRRNPILRRKSTGSASDMISPSLNGSNGIPAARQPVSSTETTGVMLPRSNSVSVKDPDVWLYEGKPVGGTFSRRLASIKKIQSRSDQSLNSDEISHGSSACGSGSASCNASLTSDNGSETEEGFEDYPASPARSVIEGSSGTVSISSSGPLSLIPDTLANEDTKGGGVGTITKLDKYLFLLVNIEEDPDILNPDSFGLEGDMVQCGFDDYPDEVFDEPIKGEVDTVFDTTSWIRRSCEELPLEFGSTTFERKHSTRMGPRRSPSKVMASLEQMSGFSSLSVGNLAVLETNQLSTKCCETVSDANQAAPTKCGPHRPRQISVIDFPSDRPGIEV